MKEYIDRKKNIDWVPMYRLSDINLAYSYFEEEVLKILDSMAPMKIITPRRNPNSWVSNETKNMMKIRDQTKELAAVSNQVEAWERYRTLRNVCNYKVKKTSKNTIRISMKN